MEFWRIATGRFPGLDGRGAALIGGRWNSPGRPLVYASTRLSLAMLELLVRLPLGEAPRDLVRIRIVVPDNAPVEELRPEALPGWNAADRVASRTFGDAWLEELRSLVLLVPAIAVAHERNALINPRHPAFARISTDPPMPVAWDERLFERR